MRIHCFKPLLAVMAVGLLAALPAVQGQGFDSPPPVPDGGEGEARGPVHEAVAEPSEGPPGPGPLVNREPPTVVEEVPPDLKPEGDHVLWIPGYWGWDDERSDYLWVSGFWRNVPPSRRWVPGSWQRVSAGYQWVHGYWGA